MKKRVIWALRIPRTVVGSVITLTGCLISAPGWAQSAGSAQGDQATSAAATAQRQAASADSLADRADLQEVVVTATRREEAALQVPASLTVLGGDTLDQLGAKSIQD
jgi:outer membrane receptor protein involved in Fe transport